MSPEARFISPFDDYPDTPLDPAFVQTRQYDGGGGIFVYKRKSTIRVNKSGEETRTVS